uniref:nucleotidyltransferase domain-containing protein n=1 Tax=Alistipes sp. TaxID=1872444 RepID=UPI004056F8E1
MPREELSTTLLALLRAALSPKGGEESLVIPSTKDWPELYRLASQQGVLAMAWEGVEHLLREQGEERNEAELPDRRLRLQWGLNVANIETRYAKQRELISRLATFYKGHGIRLMLLKGYGLSLLYPTPSHRECGDIDIWLYGEQRRADKLLTQEKGIKIDEDKHHHTTFILGGVMVENHYDFLNVHAHRSNREIEAELQRICSEEEGRKIEVNGAEVWLPSPNFNALFLLRHAAAHFAAAEISLRHVVDWAMLLREDAPKIDWRWLDRLCREQNMHRFFYALTALSIDHLGLSAEGLPPIERERRLEEEILAEILHPRFEEKMPERGLARRLWYRYRRWWANRWKHRLVYREGLFATFLQQIISHLMKPKSLR